MDSDKPTPAPATPLDLSLSIVSHNCREYLGPLLDSIRARQGSLSVEVLMVDNASSDGSVELVRARYPEVQLIANPVGRFFIRATNQNLRRSRGRYVLLLNEDATIPPETLERMVRFMDAHPDIGVLGPQLVGFDGVAQKTCCRLPTPLDAVFQYLFLHTLFPKNPVQKSHTYADWDHASIRAVDVVSGMGMMIRRTALEAVGWLDESTLMYNEEIDFCRRVLSAGWKVVFNPDLKVNHYGAASTSKNPPWTIYRMLNESALHYYRKYYGWPAYGGLRILYWLSTALLALKRLLIPGRGHLKP